MISDPVTLLAAGAVFLLVLIFVHVPVGAAMAISGIVGFGLMVGFGPAFSTVAIETTTALSSHDLATIPLFLLMGSLAARARLSRDIYDLANAFIGHWRGGLAMSTVAGCAGFGALCGSSLATTATMARIALPEMRSRGYSSELSAGSIAAGGGLGILIPPSIIMVIYAVLTEQFVLDLFKAGILPGILAVSLYWLTIGIFVRLKPGSASTIERFGWPERLRAIGRSWRAIVIIAAVTGGIYSGVFTVLEAASVGAGLTFFFFLATPTENRWQDFVEVLVETARSTGMIFLMVIGANLFSYFLTISGAAEELVNAVSTSGLNAYVILVLILLMYLVLGAIFDSVAAMVLTIPFVFPLMLQLGFDPIWWGVMNVMIIEIGMITPPIGLNVFVMHGMADDLPLKTIFRGIAPFLVADFVRLALLIAFPIIALALV